MAVSRRTFLHSAAVAAGMAWLPLPGLASGRPLAAGRRVIVIGGGYAGATAAKYLRMWAPEVDVVLIERHARFVSCPQSNLVLSGHRSLQQLTRDYHGLSDQHGVRTVQAEVTAIDSQARRVRLHDGVEIDYDRLVIAPGVDFIYDQLPMLASREAQMRIPHGWRAGEQTLLLRRQLEAMREGGTVVMTIPPAPFKCPPGPYERACQIALYLKRHKPRGKLIVLDANGDIVSKKSLFVDAWQQHYSGVVEYLPSNAVEHVDVDSLTVESLFDTIEADVLNVIPSQKAGAVAQMAGVINVDQRWCRVDFTSYESTEVPYVHVIGDAIASKMPKSGHVANAQAKVCAAAVAALLREQQPEQEPVFSNTCYSFVDGERAGHVAAVFRYDADSSDMVAMPGGGVSAVASVQEGRYAEAWARNIWADMLR